MDNNVTLDTSDENRLSRLATMAGGGARGRKRTKLRGPRVVKTVTFERAIADLAERLALGDWNCAEAEAFRRLANRGAITASDPKIDKEIRLRSLLEGISEEEVILELILAGARATQRKG